MNERVCTKNDYEKMQLVVKVLNFTGKCCVYYNFWLHLKLRLHIHMELAIELFFDLVF